MTSHLEGADSFLDCRSGPFCPHTLTLCGIWLTPDSPTSINMRAWKTFGFCKGGTHWASPYFLCKGPGHRIPDQMSLPMARSVSPGTPFLTGRSLPILITDIFCRSMGLQADAFDTRR